MQITSEPPRSDPCARLKPQIPMHSISWGCPKIVRHSNSVSLLSSTFSIHLDPECKSHGQIIHYRTAENVQKPAAVFSLFQAKSFNLIRKVFLVVWPLALTKQAPGNNHTGDAVSLLMLWFYWSSMAALLETLSGLMAFPRFKYKLSQGPAMFAFDLAALPLVRTGMRQALCKSTLLSGKPLRIGWTVWKKPTSPFQHRLLPYLTLVLTSLYRGLDHCQLLWSGYATFNRAIMPNVFYGTWHHRIIR